MVSVIIPSRSPAVGLWATIAACEHQEKCEYIIITSGSSYTPGHLRLLHNLPGRCKIAELNHGPAQARNLGASLSSGDILLFMDDHVIVPPTYIVSMKSNFNVWPDAIFHVPFTSFPDGPVWYEYGDDEKPYQDHPKSYMQYEVLSGSHGCFATTRKTWDKIGGYDERFDRYGGEEVYFGLKAKKHRIPVMMDPQLTVFHYSPPVHDTPWKLDYFPKEKELCDELR